MNHAQDQQPAQPKDEGHSEDEYSDYIGDVRPRDSFKPEQQGK